MAITTQAQPTIIVDSASEINSAWPDGTIVIERNTKKKFIISTGAIYEQDIERLNSTSRNAVEINFYGTESSAAGEIRFMEKATAGSNLIAFKSPSSILDDVVWILPDHPGTSGQLLGSLGVGASGMPLYWATPAGGAGAPVAASYVTLSVDGALTGERVLTGTSNQLVITDNGANGTVVLSTPQSVNIGASVQFAQMIINGPASVSAQLTVGKLISSSRNALELSPWGTEGSATAEIRFLEVPTGSNVVGFKAPSAILDDSIWILPDHAGTSGQVLATLGPTASGNPTYWATPSTGTAGALAQTKRYLDSGASISASYTAVVSRPFILPEGITLTIETSAVLIVI